MVFFNYTTMQVSAKIVYYGPGLCGKTTNLQQIHSRTESGSRGEMVSLETEADRTLFFDLLPLEVGTIGGMRVRLQLYTVPGQVFYNTTRKLVLKGVDGIVFVADSQTPALDANVESLGNLDKNLAELGIALDTVPMVLQFNKRDLRNIHSIDTLNEHLNPNGLDVFEGAALHGIGVFETLKAISKKTLAAVHRRISGSTNDQEEEMELASEVDSAVEARTVQPAGEVESSLPVTVEAEPAPQVVAATQTAANTMTADLFSQLAQEVDLDAEPIVSTADPRSEELGSAFGAPSATSAERAIQPVSEPPEEREPAPSSEQASETTATSLVPGGSAEAPSIAEDPESDPDTSEVKIEFAARGTAPEFRPEPEVSEPMVDSDKRKVLTKSANDIERELQALRSHALGGGPQKAPKRVRVVNVQRKAKVALPESVLSAAEEVEVTLRFRSAAEGDYQAKPIMVQLPKSDDAGHKRLELELDLKRDQE